MVGHSLSNFYWNCNFLFLVPQRKVVDQEGLANFKAFEEIGIAKFKFFVILSKGIIISGL